jgi:hypothetical protein
MNQDADFFTTLPLDAIVSERSDQVIPAIVSLTSIPSNPTTQLTIETPSVEQGEQNEQSERTIECLTIYSPKGSFIVPSSLWNSLNAIQRIAYKIKALG